MRTLLLLSAITLSAALRRSASKTDLFFHRRRRTASRYASMDWDRHFKEYMRAMTATSSPRGFNPKCEPYINEPRGESRGLILLQHGYTACAGFWYLLTPTLVQQGWTVMAPSLPGHGRMPEIRQNGSISSKATYEVTDYAADLPQNGDEYEDYSKELIEIARKYRTTHPGKKMSLVGCSHGGAVAAYMAMNGEVGTWDRVFLMNPFLAPPTAMGADYGLSFLRYILPEVLPAFKFIAGDRISWGESCETKRWPGDPRNGGHGGICQFEVENFRAVLQFGNMVEGEARVRASKEGVFTGGVVDRALGVTEMVKHNIWQLFTGGGHEPPSNMQVQLLTTSKDGSISNSRVHFAAAALKKMVKDSNSGYCALDAEFGHTYINPVDKDVGTDMWYLDGSRTTSGKTVLDLMVDFLSDGTLFPVDGTVQDDKFILGDPRCDMTQRR